MGIENNGDVEKNQEQIIENNDTKSEQQEQFDKNIKDIECDLNPPAFKDSKGSDGLKEEQSGLKKNEGKQEVTGEVEKNKVKEDAPQNNEEKLDMIGNSLQPKQIKDIDNNLKDDEKEERPTEQPENKEMLKGEIDTIKDDTYNKYVNDGEVSQDDKAKCVSECKEKYDSYPKEERGDILVPENPEHLNDPPISGNNETGQRYDDFNYKWPKNNGFEGEPTEITPKEGQQFDRLGNEKGRFVATIDNGQVQPKEDRGLPYHFTESNITDEPSYHQYEVTRDFDELKDAINEYDNPKLTSEENDEMRQDFMDRYDSNTRQSLTYTHEPGKTYSGKIADAFEKDDGGGNQWELPMAVEDLKELGMIKEI